MKIGLIIPDPRRQLLLDDLPYAVFPFHPENNTVAAVIAHIYGEQPFLQSIGFAEIEFSQPPVRFYELGELNVSDELYMHTDDFELLDYQFLCY